MHTLDRFVAAQAQTYDRAIAELRAGLKTGHWMWFVFPQVAGLGRSDTARLYAIADLAEARAFLTHSVLGPRLVEATRALLDLPAGRTAEAVLGGIDTIKLRSSLTLFDAAAADRPDDRAVFRAALDRFFGGRRDAETVRRLPPGAAG